MATAQEIAGVHVPAVELDFGAKRENGPREGAPADRHAPEGHETRDEGEHGHDRDRGDPGDGDHGPDRR